MKKPTIVLAYALFAAACGSDSTAPKTTEAPPASAPEIAHSVPDAAEARLYAIAVNDLLLRREPTQQSKDVITKFKQGDLVTGTGEISPKKETATIRGIERSAPFVKVVSTTPAQHTGWAFGAGLLPLYAGPRSGSPELGKLQQLTSFIAALPTKQLDSGKKAWDYVRANFAAANGALADAASIVLADFLHRMETEGEYYTVTEKLNWTDADHIAVANGTFNMQKFPQTQQLAASGFRLETAEGMVFPVADWTALEAFFQSRTTEPMKRFIHQRVVEQRNAAMSDGGVVIPWNDIADRAAFWEQFVRQNPNFPLIDEAKESMHWYRFTLTNGGDNTPIASFEDNTILDEIKSVWAYVLEKYPGTELARTVQQVNDMAKASGWKVNDQIRGFQEQQAKIYMETH
jgi:hypothetical protein